MSTHYNCTTHQGSELLEAVYQGQVPGLSLHAAEGPEAKYWPLAITDGQNCLWPEGQILHRWGNNQAEPVLRLLRQHLRARFVEYN